MDRRKFLKILGVGITIPLIPNIAISKNKLNLTKSLHNKQPPKAEVVGGYDLAMDRSWFRTAVYYNGTEWHDEMLVNGRIDDPKKLADIQNQAYKRNNLPCRITEEEVRKAFENHS